MATAVSSSDAWLLLSKWKGEHSLLDVFCVGMDGGFNIMFRKVFIHELSEDSACLLGSESEFSFVFRGAEFKYLEPREIPPELSAKVPIKFKSILQSFDNRKAVFLVELDIDSERSA